MMKNPKFFVLMLLSFLLPAAGGDAAPGSVAEGITLPVTRVIYPESKKSGITFTVTNNTERVFLLQSRVIPADDDDGADGPVPFIVVPPLTRFAPGEAVTLLIRQTEKLPAADRESHWRLALKTIPAQQGNSVGPDSGSSLILAMQNNLKLFYRPDGMTEMKDDERAERLQFAQRDGYLIVTNPTPYHITLGELTADGKPVTTDGDRMIAPFWSARYPVAQSVSQVGWTIIRDDGRYTELSQRPLS